MFLKGLMSQNEIIEELIYRNKIQNDAGIEIIEINEEDVFDFQVFKQRRRNMYLVVFCYISINENILDKIVDQFGDNREIIMIFCQRNYHYWLQNYCDIDNLHRMLQERYIKVKDVDRLFTIEHWLSSDHIFSIMLITK
jgi:hypothetical protein